MTFASTLLQWYSTHKRTLPWRGITDPYRIWLSEIILQQTQIAQGRDYYLRFTEHFPSVEILAEASEDEVMKLWEGLGYYSRARNLHAAARQIVAHGSFPRHYEDVRALKGIGDYTAAAICSIAYNDPIATLDGNAYRVYGRIYSIEFPFLIEHQRAIRKPVRVIIHISSVHKKGPVLALGNKCVPFRLFLRCISTDFEHTQGTRRSRKYNRLNQNVHSPTPNTQHHWRNPPMFAKC